MINLIRKILTSVYNINISGITSHLSFNKQNIKSGSIEDNIKSGSIEDNTFVQLR